MTNALTGEGLPRFEESPCQEESSHPEERHRSIETPMLADSTIESTRYHYMDNLRALAMLAGVFFHAALAYSPMMQNLWLTADAQNSVLLDAVAWFSHLFRMPLFFLISGFFALMLIEKRGNSGFLKNRSLRILLPFIIFLPLVLISLIILIGWSASNVENLSPMMQFIAATMNNPDIPQLPFSTTHLWFLFNLILFCLVLALLQKLRLFSLSILNRLANPAYIVFGVPLLLIPALYSQSVPLPAPERIYPELWSFGFFGVFFLLGGIIYQNQSLLNSLKKYNWVLLATSLLGYALLYSYLPSEITFADIMASMQDTPKTWTHLLQVTLEAYISVHMTFFCLSTGRSFLNNHSKIFKFISSSSYWVYIVHLPVLFYLQFLLMDIQLGLWPKFLIASFGTIIIGIVSYVILIRWTPIGWLLNGRKKPNV